jgi:hypothetical protein
MSRYGTRHRAIRRALLPEAYGRPCARCGETMRPGQDLDLDHTDDGLAYLGFSHRACNVKAGARKGYRRMLEAAGVKRGGVF